MLKVFLGERQGAMIVPFDASLPFRGNPGIAGANSLPGASDGCAFGLLSRYGCGVWAENRLGVEHLDGESGSTATLAAGRISHFSTKADVCLSLSDNARASY